MGSPVVTCHMQVSGWAGLKTNGSALPMSNEADLVEMVEMVEMYAVVRPNNRSPSTVEIARGVKRCDGDGLS